MAGPRIPVVSEARVQDRPLAPGYVHNDVKPGWAALAAGLGAAADAAGKVGAAANATAANDQVTAYKEKTIKTEYGDPDAAPQSQTPADASDSQKTLDKTWDEAGPPPQGYLSTRGKDAAKYAQPTMEYLQQQRQEMADALENDEQRQLFMKHTEQIYLGTLSRVESHTSSQRQEAEQASLSGRIAVSLNEAAKNYTDVDGTLSTEQKAVEQTIRAFASPMGDEDAKVAAYRERMSSTRLKQYIGAKDWRGAQAYFDQAKGNLGAEAGAFQKQIDGVKRDGVADGIAMELSKEFKDGAGRVDVDAAIDKIDASITDDVALKDEAKQRVQQYAIQSERHYKKMTEEISNAAVATYNTEGWTGIPTELKDELNTRNPELYYRLQHDFEREFRERKSTAAAARKEQNDRNRIAVNDFMTMPVDMRAKEDLQEWAAGRGLDALGTSQLKRAQRNSMDYLTHSTASKESEFLMLARSEGQGIATGKKSEKELTAEAHIAYQDFATANKRAPSDKEAMDLAAQLVAARITPGYLYGTNEEPEFAYRARMRREGKKPDTATPARRPGDVPVPPGLDLDAKPKPTVPVLQRYQELKKAGKSPADIAATLNAEGYQKGK